MRTEDAFLQAILAQPDDDAPRLIYADWLDEHNDPRGEFIRVQCALAQLDAEDPLRWPLEAREQELLREHETKWFPKFSTAVPCVFRRGFVEQVTLTPEEFLVSVARLCEQTPLRRLRLQYEGRPLIEPELHPDSALARVARSPYLARLTGLSLIGNSFGRCEIQALLQSPHIRQLTELQFPRVNLNDEWLIVRDEFLPLPKLRKLDLKDNNPLPETFFRSLAEAAHLPELTTLILSNTGTTQRGLRVLLSSSRLTKLTELNLRLKGLTPEVMSLLAESRLLQQLETLDLSANAMGDNGAMALGDWPTLPRLKRLSLAQNQIFSGGVQHLASAPALTNLVSLDLYGNISGDYGTVALASSSLAAALRALNLRFNGVGDKGVRALARSPLLTVLTSLNLTANRITNGGARVLIESKYLPALVRLELLRNDIAPEEQRCLRERYGPFVAV